jgi:hypothetical protein
MRRPGEPQRITCGSKTFSRCRADRDPDPTAGLDEPHRGEDPEDLADDRPGHAVPLDEVVDVEGRPWRQLTATDRRAEAVEDSCVQPWHASGEWDGCNPCR